MLKNPRQNSKIILLILLILSVVFSWFLKDLKFSYDFEAFFPQGDEDLNYYEDFRKSFETDHDYLFLTIVNQNGVFRRSFLEKIDRLSDTLAHMPYVTQVQSPTNLSNLIWSPFGVIEVPFLHVDREDLYADDSSKIFREKNLLGTFFSKDAKAVSIFIKHDQNIAKWKCDTLLHSIEREVNKLQFDHVYYTGRIHGQYYYIKKIRQEMILFLGASFVLVFFFLWWSFRNLKMVFIPLIVILLTMLWLAIVMGLNKKGIDLIFILLPTILFVVGVSDSVHLISRFFDLRTYFGSNWSTLLAAFEDVGLATFFTSLTTAIGFISLIYVNIKPIQSFGLYTALGVGFAFILTYVIVPSFLLMSSFKFEESPEKYMLQWRAYLYRLFVWLMRRRKLVLSIFMGFTILGLLLLSRINFDNFLLEDISDQDPIKQGYHYHEKHFSGSRPFEIGIEFNHTSPWDISNVRQIDSVSVYLEKEYGVNMMVSYVSILKMINRAKHGGNMAFYKIPDSQQELDRLASLMKKYKKLFGLSTFMSRDETRARISGKMNDFGSKICTQKNQKFYNYVAQTYSKNMTYRITGMGFLIDKNNNYIVANMLRGLLLSAAVIALVMMILFRDWRMVYISLIPNLVPLLMVGAFMALCGIHFNVSTSIIFTIAFGIAVDDTIHFLMKYRQEHTKSNLWALRNTFLHTGKAIIITTIILSGGFFMLVFSSFTSIFNIGLLISLTLIFAVLADLFLLPLLILYFFRRK